MNFAEYDDEALSRWVWLRAIEWGNWPAYLSQPIAPVLFIAFPWYFVVLGVLLLGVAWSLVRYSFVSPRLADAAVLPVVCLKWPAAIGSCIYLVLHHQFAPGLIALFWPFLAAFVGVPAKRRVIELALSRKIGFAAPDAEI